MLLAYFGLFMALAYGSPWWVWLIGFLCLLIDADRR